jgi:predicted O-methyltransferase YrrM
MNLVTRTTRLIEAALRLPTLDKATSQARDDPRKIVDLTFNYCAKFLEPIQLETEISRLLKDVQLLQPTRVLEIGTSYGGTLYLWTRAASPDATIISIDLPGGKFGGGYSQVRAPLYRRFARDKQVIHLLRADSHAPETQAHVRKIFKNAKIDFLFIDGDHTYEGVRQDWEQYAPLVRDGGLIAFHDIATNYEDTHVKRLWDEIKPGHTYDEYVDDPQGRFGIGLIRI